MQLHQRALTPREIAINEAAAKCLEPGKYYLFDSTVVATGYPIQEAYCWKQREFAFNRGLYLGFLNGVHTFLGTPIARPAEIPADQAECYFDVIFVGGKTGAVARLDRKQEPITV